MFVVLEYSAVRNIAVVSTRPPCCRSETSTGISDVAGKARGMEESLAAVNRWASSAKEDAADAKESAKVKGIIH